MGNLQQREFWLAFEKVNTEELLKRAKTFGANTSLLSNPNNLEKNRVPLCELNRSLLEIAINENNMKAFQALTQDVDVGHLRLNQNTDTVFGYCIRTFEEAALLLASSPEMKAAETFHEQLTAYNANIQIAFGKQEQIRSRPDFSPPDLLLALQNGETEVAKMLLDSMPKNERKKVLNSRYQATIALNSGTGFTTRRYPVYTLAENDKGYNFETLALLKQYGADLGQSYEQYAPGRGSVTTSFLIDLSQRIESTRCGLEEARTEAERAKNTVLARERRLTELNAAQAIAAGTPVGEILADGHSFAGRLSAERQVDKGQNTPGQK